MQIQEFFGQASPNFVSPDEIRACIDKIAAYVEAYSIQPAPLREKFICALRAETEGAERFEQVFRTIQRTLPLLEDNHSQIFLPQDWQTLTNTEQQLPSGQMTDNVACLKVPGFSIDRKTSAAEYVAHCHTLIAGLDRYDPKGWIIDLRGNHGGSSWPMIAGLGPLFESGNRNDEGLLGYFLLRNERHAWGYKDGQSWGATEDFSTRWINVGIDNPYRLENSAPSVAVLMGPCTVSAGETVCVAALGLKPRVRIFGAPSGGQATGNGRVSDMPLGAALFIAVSSYADRHGSALDRTLQPDVSVRESGPKDPVPVQALKWLLSGKPEHKVAPWTLSGPEHH